MTKLTPAKIKYFIADEKKAAKEYRRYGLSNLAKDESKHKRYLQALGKMNSDVKIKKSLRKETREKTVCDQCGARYLGHVCPKCGYRTEFDTASA
jgi:rubrerythrin